MKYHKKLIPAALISALLLSGCGTVGSEAKSANTAALPSALTGTLTAAASDNTEKASETKSRFTKRDLSGSFSDTVCEIALSGTGADCDSEAVSCTDGRLIISAEGTYIISGEFSGSLIVDAHKDDKVQLVLNGVKISSADSAAIYISQADKVFITLAEGTVNTLTSTAADSADDDSSIDAAIYAKDQLTINGSGGLELLSENLHGIICKDELRITGGIISVKAAKRGISSKHSIAICGASIDINSGKVGIRANSDDEALGNIYIESGEINISSADDCLHAGGEIDICGGKLSLSSSDDAVHADSAVYISGGEITVLKSYEGIEARQICISGGDITVKADDDGLNAAGGNDGSGFMGPGGGNDSFFGMRPGRSNDFAPPQAPDGERAMFDGDKAGNERFAPGGFGGGFGADESCSIEISGGMLTVNAEGDGIDSNGTLTVSGGVIHVSGPTNSGNGALDYGSSAVITGGTVIAAGSSGMAENFGGESAQCSVLFSTGSQTGGTELTLKDSKGNEILSFIPEKKYECVVISTPEIKLGETYSLTAGSSTVEVTVESIISGQSRGMFGGFGDRNGRHPGKPFGPGDDFAKNG